MPDRDSASDTDDSGDCSRRGGAKMNQQQQQQQQPSCSKNSAPDKRNRRIIMRIEFNDSDDTDEANPPNPGDDPDLDARPSCSTAATRLCRSARRQRRPPAIQDSNSDSDALQRRSTRIRRTRYGPQSDDCSSSGSEIEQRPKRLRGQSGKRKMLESDEEEPSDEDETKKRLSPRRAPPEDPGFSSDSSSNELLEKCPICLFTFRQQEIGTPATCEHIFCAPCIEAWSKNVQTCPIDRITFDRIVVRENYADRNVVREVRVDLSKSKTELALEDEEDADAAVADVTNCEICNSPEREDVMLLCDSCNQGYHMDCLDPPLNEIPEGSWYCDECIDSNDENSDDNLDLAEDLNMLYEDIRGMGLPETRLRVREVQQQPRILRTRQNERIRAAVLRRTRAATSAEAASGSTTTRTRTTRTTTTTTTTTRTTTNRRQTTRRRRRRTRHRTYVVEYDLNNFDEKFALKTTSKKVIRRRRRRRRRVAASSVGDETGRRRLTASKRLAEQLGVKADGLRSYLSGGNASSFTLFGNANDLEYFSDSEGGQDDSGAVAGAGLGATAVQTSVRIASIGNPRTRKALLQGKARTAATTSASSASDILSSILDLQDRWHGASRNLSEVQIRADGSLNLPQRAAATAAPTPPPAPAPTAAASKPPAQPITQAPLYQRGGAGPNFGRGGGGGSSGNRYGGNNSYNRGGGGGGATGNQYQRHSTGGDGSGGSSQGGSAFNQNCNQNNTQGGNNNSSNNVFSFTPFTLNRQQQQQQQQQQRIQSMNQRQQLPGPNSSPFRGSGPNNLPAAGSPASNNFSQRPPIFPLSHITAQVMPGPGLGSVPAVGHPVLTVPPPPTPPASLSWNSPLFKMSTDYAQQGPTAAAMTTKTQSGRRMDDDDDADNCPNFSIYSQESQAVANATALPIGPQPRPTLEEADKEDDDMNEDLVQLDDDDDDEEAAAAQEDNSIPLPPEKASDLYEPENPTEEQDEGDSNIDGEPMEEEEPEHGPRSEPEPETERISSNSNSNLEATVDEDEETKTHSTPSPSPRVRDRGGAERDRGKGVLELYDDSDWEELDIDKPKEFEKALDATEVAAAETPEVSVTSQPTPAKKKDKDKKKDKERAARNRSSSDREPDRSYTPCLDEKGDGDDDDDDDEKASAASVQQQVDVSTSPKTPCSKSSDDEEIAEPEPAENIGTELISDDDLGNENDSKQRRSRSRRRSEGGGAATPAATPKDTSREKESKSKRSKRGKDETFKKVSKRPKERNYRGDKQTDETRSGSRRRTRTPRRTPAASRSPQSPRGSRSPPQPHSRSRSRSPSRSRSRSPIRSRNRRRPRGSRSKSYSRSRSRSRSNSNGRHGRSFRGRDFQRGGFQRGRGGLRFNYNRNQQQFHNRPYQHFHNQGQNHQNQHYFHNNQNHQYHMQNQNQNFYQRPKRRELARYDVRNVVGAGSRHNMPTAKDRYGRDAMRSARSRSGGSFERRRSSHSPAFSRSGSRGGAPSRSRSPTPKRLRSFSISPSPPPGVSPHRKQQRRRSMSPGPGRRYVRSPSASPPKQRRESPPMHPMHSMHGMERGHSPISLRSVSHTPTRVNGGRNLAAPPVYHNSPRYTPRLSRSRTRSKSPKAVIKKKKKKSDKKKKNKKRTASTSPTTAARMRRISRQRDPFEDADDFLAPQKKRRHSPPISKGVPPGHWSPSPSLSDDHMKFIHDGGDKNSSWTPPLGSPKGLLGHPGHGHYADDGRRSGTPLGIGKKAKRKRDKSKKKKKPIDKLQRKEKKNRKRRTQTPEPIPSKEVFASGNNILVSVSFNKEPASGTNASGLQQQQQQQTVVTMPALRHDDLLANRLTGSSMDRLLGNASVKPKLKKDKTRKRKKLDAKPVAIIDLERSPFQVHQEPADVIVLTDSEDANEAPPQHPMRRDRDRESREQQQQEQQQQQRERHQRRRGSGVASPTEHHDLMRENGQREKTPQVDSLATIMETSSYETLQQTTGPKTPPEPPIVKFNLPAKKQHKVRSNPLHEDADDINSADELEAACSSRELPGAGIDDHTNDTQQQQQQPHGHTHDSGTQKIGPNTPPESGPCSPDAYDPFEPTKSPSLSPRSPTPTPTQNLEQALPNSSGPAGPGDKSDSDSHSHSHNQAPTAVSNSTGTQTQTSGVINPVDLVMALMNKPNQSTNTSSQQEKAGGKACDVVTSTQYLGSSTSMSAGVVGSSAGAGGGDGGHDKTMSEGNTITVLSNVLLSGSSVVSSSQHIPVISSPTPLAKKLTPLPKAGGGSVASSSSCGIANLPTTSSGLRNGGGSGNTATAAVSALDDSFTMDIESPYSPGSADYEDLFEPPPQQRSKGGAKTEMFDNLFGSTSPVGNIARMSRFKKSQRANNKGERKSRKGKSSDDHKGAYDDLPNSATDLQNKDRFLRKLNRQERVVEEVKLVLKPHFNKKVITKEDYKDIMRRAVPKICHSRSGEINPHKIKNLIDAYVRKFRSKHKKLSLLNTGQVSSAVKCAAYLKKL